MCARPQRGGMQAQTVTDAASSRHDQHSHEGQQEQNQQQQQHDGQYLPTELLLQVFQWLPPNEQACSCRPTCKPIAAALSSPHHRTAYLSQPLPPHAVPWFERYGPKALKQLSFKMRLLLPMCAAATSGSEANLAAVWGMVQQCTFPELLQSGHYRVSHGRLDVGVVLVREGHAHLLPWLLDSGCPFDARATLVAAAQHCNLDSFQAAWQLLLQNPHLHLSLADGQELLHTAAQSPTSADAISKMQWLMAEHSHVCCSHAGAVIGAACIGDLPGLVWLHQYAPTLPSTPAGALELHPLSVLAAALTHGAGTDVLDWLVDYAECSLPAPPPSPASAAARPTTAPDAHRHWYSLWLAAASGGVATVEWMLRRGMGPPHPYAVVAAACSGSLEAVQLLHVEASQGRGADEQQQQQQQEQQERQLSTQVGALAAAVASGSVAKAEWLLQQLLQQLGQHGMQGVWGIVGAECFLLAARHGDLRMLTWLLRDAGCPGGEARTLVSAWPVAAARGPRADVASGHWDSSSSSRSDRGVRGWGSSRDGGCERGGVGGGVVGSEAQLLAAVQLLAEANGGWHLKKEEGGAAVEGTAAGSASHAVIDIAAVRGNLPLVRYLHEQLGCDITPRTLDAAAGGGCCALVEWLSEQGYWAWEWHGDPYLPAALNGDLATLECLRQLGVPWGKDVLLAAVGRDCPLSVLQWMVAHGAPAGRREVARALAVAERAGWLLPPSAPEVVVWLRGLREEGSWWAAGRRMLWRLGWWWLWWGGRSGA